MFPNSLRKYRGTPTYSLRYSDLNTQSTLEADIYAGGIATVEDEYHSLNRYPTPPTR